MIRIATAADIAALHALVEIGVPRRQCARRMDA